MHLEETPAPPPAHPEIGVIALLPDSWQPRWMGRHHIMRRLARHFRVVWMNPPRDWREFLPGGRASPDSSRTGFSVRDSGLIVFNPGRWYPRVWKPAALGRLLERARLAKARARLRAEGCRKIILYVVNPHEAGALDTPHDLSCYHIFDEYSFSEVEREVDPAESSLIRRVGQVFISSEAMFRKKGGLNPRSLVMPNGVDYPAFSTPAEEPPDLGAIPHPRIGYVGVVKKQLNLGLVARLAKARPGWHFTFIGPNENVVGAEAALAELQALPNVHFLGLKPAVRLPGYTQHLDVCLLCYHVNDYTKFISPLKLHEYLAAGRPVVGSDIDPIRSFGELIRVARSDGEWESAIEACLRPEAVSEAEIRKRRERAREMDWDGLVGRIAEVLRSRLG